MKSEEGDEAESNILLTKDIGDNSTVAMELRPQDIRNSDVPEKVQKNTRRDGDELGRSQTFNQT